MGKAGETNESLTTAFLVSREGHKTCRGVVDSVRTAQEQYRRETDRQK